MIHNTYKTIQKQTIIIREPEKGDAKNILKYIDIVSDETDYLTFGPGERIMPQEEEEKFIDTCLTSENKIMLIAEIKKEIAGCLVYRGGDRPRTEHTGEFGLSVKKAFWRVGIGSIMISNLIDWAKANRIIKKINLRVREDNTRAINLYERFGFVREGLITKEIHIGDKYYDNIFMGLVIEL